MTAPYHGSTNLSDANRVFLAALCVERRARLGMTQVQLAAIAGCRRWVVEYIEILAPVGREGLKAVVDTVLAVSPVCRKGESPHIQPATGASHGTKEEADSRAH